MEHHQVDALTQDVSDKPAASGEDGVWQTTQLDSAIGDLQRRGTLIHTPLSSIFFQDVCVLGCHGQVGGTRFQVGMTGADQRRCMSAA